MTVIYAARYDRLMALHARTPPAAAAGKPPLIHRLPSPVPVTRPRSLVAVHPCASFPWSISPRRRDDTGYKTANRPARQTQHLFPGASWRLVRADCVEPAVPSAPSPGFASGRALQAEISRTSKPTVSSRQAGTLDMVQNHCYLYAARRVSKRGSVLLI